MINKPYVKQYNEKGEVSNPIIGKYVSFGDNRKQRRANLNKTRFKGNKKGISLTVINNGISSSKYNRVSQSVPLFETESCPRIDAHITGYKTVNHYIKK